MPQSKKSKRNRKINKILSLGLTENLVIRTQRAEINLLQRQNQSLKDKLKNTNNRHKRISTEVQQIEKRLSQISISQNELHTEMDNPIQPLTTAILSDPEKLLEYLNKQNAVMQELAQNKKQTDDEMKSLKTKLEVAQQSAVTSQQMLAQLTTTAKTHERSTHQYQLDKLKKPLSHKFDGNTNVPRATLPFVFFITRNWEQLNQSGSIIPAKTYVEHIHNEFIEEAYWRTLLNNTINSVIVDPNVLAETIMKITPFTAELNIINSQITNTYLKPGENLEDCMFRIKKLIEIQDFVLKIELKKRNYAEDQYIGSAKILNTGSKHIINELTAIIFEILVRNTNKYWTNPNNTATHPNKDWIKRTLIISKHLGKLEHKLPKYSNNDYNGLSVTTTAIDTLIAKFQPLFDDVKLKIKNDPNPTTNKPYVEKYPVITLWCKHCKKMGHKMDIDGKCTQPTYVRKRRSIDSDHKDNSEYKQHRSQPKKRKLNPAPRTGSNPRTNNPTQNYSRPKLNPKEKKKQFGKTIFGFALQHKDACKMCGGHLPPLNHKMSDCPEYDSKWSTYSPEQQAQKRIENKKSVTLAIQKHRNDQNNNYNT